MSKEKMISIRVSDEEKQYIEKKAKKKRLTVSQMFIQLFYRFWEKL
jgi:uncharacterized protein (DUF1778 family)